MQQQPDVYLESHKQVLKWTKELEFLGYILSEIVDPDGLERRGYYCHQAADLPAIVDTLKCACSQPHSRLRGVLGKQAAKYFSNLLKKSKQIRNAMAHHLALSEERMLALQGTKQELDRIFQCVISRAASRYNIQQVTWYPDDTEFSGPSHRHTETIALGGEPPLYQRQRILWSEAGPSNRPKKKKQKEKATEESRAAHLIALEASLRRKIGKIQKEKAQIMEAKARKFQTLEQTYRQRWQERMEKINRILLLTKDEERDLKVQHGKIFGEPFGANVSTDALFILLLLALSSPLWLSGLVVRKFGVQIVR
ncbi:uncharacterized protein BO87DRAFT_450839 [Aspergillus neoniger CBS 115656]|uniref:Uncharacterized protein n=1 Tax=Aspergillus neoniger (strain CBS 115656) TaxID=1448310 RepID=A0A318YT66_ASPNB|nr:hypothetical protein BO87DRAFT_450839 [Aspergillus neoniger CBS 115656]PYH37606.1 hypothetical protein BO87DRAFT_450839 [Aspergillus neoniger CBS 115656]